jgi:hypothetical protein
MKGNMTMSTSKENAPKVVPTPDKTANPPEKSNVPPEKLLTPETFLFQVLAKKDALIAERLAAQKAAEDNKKVAKQFAQDLLEKVYRFLKPLDGQLVNIGTPIKWELKLLELKLSSPVLGTIDVSYGDKGDVYLQYPPVKDSIVFNVKDSAEEQSAKLQKFLTIAGEYIAKNLANR